MGSPSWRHADSVTMTNGSDVVTGSGTDWVTGAPVVLPGFALSVDGIYYEVVEVRSDTELQIYPAYAGTTGAKTVTIIEFGRQGIEGAKKRLADVLQMVPAAGRLLYVGSGAPSSGLGNDGALMIDVINATLYGPKAGGAWPSGVSLRGPEKRRNLIMNGRGAVNQRGYTSGAATSAANQYTLDRWRVVVSGQNLSWTETAGTRTFTAPAGGVEQVIEGAAILSGTHVLSFTGTATCTINGVARVSGDTVTMTGGVNTTIRFSGGTFSLPQLEPGSVITPYEHVHPALERLEAQRYFYRHEDAGQAYQQGTGAQSFIRLKTLVLPNMRAAPTFSVASAPTYLNCSGVAAFTTPTSADLYVTVTGAGLFRAFDGIYDFNSEL